MANQLYNQLNTNTQKRPQTDINSILNEVAQSGMSAKDLFFKKVNEMGVNPQQILSQIPPQFR